MSADDDLPAPFGREKGEASNVLRQLQQLVADCLGAFVVRNSIIGDSGHIRLLFPFIWIRHTLPAAGPSLQVVGNGSKEIVPGWLSSHKSIFSFDGYKTVNAASAEDGATEFVDSGAVRVDRPAVSVDRFEV